MTTAVEECLAGYTALSAYFQGLSDCYSGGSPPPDTASLFTDIVFQELLTFTSGNALTSATFSVGAGVEAVSHFVGVERELSMAETGKASIYISAISEHNEESSFYGQNGAFLSSVIGGAPTNGSQC